MCIVAYMGINWRGLAGGKPGFHVIAANLGEEQVKTMHHCAASPHCLTGYNSHTTATNRRMDDSPFFRIALFFTLCQRPGLVFVSFVECTKEV